MVIDHIFLVLIIAILGAMGATEVFTLWIGKLTALVNALAPLVEAIRKLW